MRGKKLARVIVPFTLFLLTAAQLTAYMSGCAAIGQKARVTVLLYHHILDSAENVNHRENGLVVSTELFEEQMRYLSDNGYAAITLLDMYGFLYEDKQLPEKSVLITFDDGYYSNFTRAYPILEKYNLHAVLFTITGNLTHEENAVFDPEITQFASVSDLQKYSGVFEYASHTHNLHKYDSDGITLFSKADKAAIAADLEQSFEITGSDLALAYPLGMYDDERIEALKETPVKLAFTTMPGAVTRKSDPYRINRHTVWSSTDIDRFAGILH